MNTRPRAVIVGGSIGGLFTALLLRRRGWDAHVYERSGTPLASRGAGIVTHPQLRRVLERLGLETRRDFGVAIHERQVLDRAGTVSGTYDCPQVTTSWNRVFRMLRTALPDACYTLGAEFTGFEPTPEGVRVGFADGRRVDATLLIGADGVRSGVRAAMVGDIVPAYAGYVAWRGLLNEADVPAALFPRFSFCLPPGEQMLGYPVAGEANDLRPGHRRYNFVWYRPADEVVALPALLTDATGHVHSLSIPPPMIRTEVLDAMRTASRTLAPAFTQVIAATRQPFLQPIFDLETPRNAQGRVVLLGDAAFVARPHVGAGVTKAAEDASCLADALADEADIGAALRRYEAERLPAGRRLVERGRQLGAYLQAHIGTDEERAAAVRHQTVEAVLEETAVLDF